MSPSRTRQFWELINEAPINPDRLLQSHGRPLWRLFKQFYLRPHWRRLLLAVVLLCCSSTWAVWYAYVGRVIADDIVEVQLLSRDTPSAAQVDVGHPDEHRRFAVEKHSDNVGADQRFERRVTRSMNEKLTLLGWLSLACLVQEIIRHGSWILGVSQTIRIGQWVQFRLRQKLHDKLQELPLSYHDRHSPGRLMTHLFSDVGVVQEGFTHLLHQLPLHVMTMALGGAVVLWLSPAMGLILVCAMPAYAFCYRWFQRRLKIVHENLREREGRLNAHIANRISSFQLVKAFVGETTEAREFLQRTRPIMRNTIGATVLNTGFVVTCGLITGTCLTVVLWLGTLRVRSGEMSVGEVLMFFGAASNLFTPIAVFTNLSSLRQRMRATAIKITRVLDEPILLADPPQPKPLPKTACTIELRNVSLRYDPKRPPAINGVNFILPAGERLCIMGPSGSGKSTLAKLIARLYDPTEGQVLFDGTDVREFAVEQLRDYIGFVSQEPVVFSGTIADNIRYGSGQANMTAVVAAAQYAQIHEFIERLPERYETLTQERGLTLSGGQKQRVNLARALLYDPRVLVLDDCTSALDAETEAKLIDGFAQALRNRTVVLVTHRVSIAMGCDRVLVLDRGKVADFGRPRELMEAGGAFAALFREQFGKGEREPQLAAS